MSAPDTPSRTTELRLRLARRTRLYGPDAPETLAARRDYNAAMATGELAERLGGPRLTDSQLDTLESLVQSTRDRLI